MTFTRGLPLRLAALLTGLALAVSGCGGGSSSSPEDPGSTPTSGNTDLPGVGPLEQLVRVRKYDVGFGLPKEWLTLDAQDVRDPANPRLVEAPRRLGVGPERLVQTLSQGVQTLSITDQGADKGVVDNVSSVGVSHGTFDDHLIRQGLTRIKAKIGPFRHVSTPAGDATVVPFYRTSNGGLIFGEVLAVDLGDAAVTITVTSRSASRADTIAAEVQRTLQRL